LQLDRVDFIGKREFFKRYRGFPAIGGGSGVEIDHEGPAFLEMGPALLLAFTVPVHGPANQRYLGRRYGPGKRTLPFYFAVHITFRKGGGSRKRHGTGSETSAFHPFKIFDAFARGSAALACARPKSIEH
jgi:hypothetical protein